MDEILLDGQNQQKWNKMTESEMNEIRMYDDDSKCVDEDTMNLTNISEETEVNTCNQFEGDLYNTLYLFRYYIKLY